MATISGMTATRRGDVVTVTGLVENQSKTVVLSWSYIQTLFPPGATNAEKKQIARQYAAGELKNRYDLDNPVTFDLSGADISIP